MSFWGRLRYLCNAVLDDLLVCHIALVAYKELVDTLGGVAVNLLEPLLNVVETVHVGDIVNDADAVSAAVVRRGNGAETLLSGGVPLFPSSAWQSFGFDLTCVDIQSGASRSFHPARWF